MQFKKVMRMILLVLFIAMAAILPVPITIYQKDKQPKFRVEQLNRKEDEEQQEENEFKF